MSLIERDLQRWFLELNPWMVGATFIILGPLAIWVIEIIRAWVNPTRPPWGLAVLRWTTVYVGDVFFLAGAMVAVAFFYDRVTINDTSWWTSRTFSVGTIVLGVLFATLFITFEEVTGAYSAELKINSNRIWHTLYFAWVSGLLLGATRVIKYGVVDGHERGLAIAAVVLVGLYLVTFAIDAMGKNPIWPFVRDAYPTRTINP